MLLETREYVYYNKLGFVLLIPFVFVFLMTMVDVKRTKLLLSTFFSNRYFYQYSIENISSISIYHLFSLGFLTSSVSLLFTFLSYGRDLFYENFLSTYFKTFFMVLGYFVLKFLITELAYFLSGNNITCKQMFMLDNSYLTALMFVFFPITAYAFLHLNSFELLLNILLVWSVISYVLRVIAIFSNNKNLLSGKLFYIISYLCTLEIIPIIYLFKGYIH